MALVIGNLVRDAKKHRIIGRLDLNFMKTNTTRNIASVAMLVILSPFLAMAILVSVKTAGIMRNDVLLLLLTLSSAVLSGINGFGRRTTVTITNSEAKTRSNGEGSSDIRWSARPSINV
jgi:hypothetical protein